MVEEHKDEPYTLMWVIGNENFNPFDQDNAEKQVEAYLTLVNEAAKLIHRLDPHHPVALCNLADRNIEQMRKYCPAVDIFGMNAALFCIIGKRMRSSDRHGVGDLPGPDHEGSFQDARETN